MRRKIENIIVNNSIDLKYVVVGTGGTYCKSKSRFIFQARERTEIQNKTAKIAIKYFKEQNLIIIWNVIGYVKNRNIQRSCFSVKCESVFENLENGVAKKIVELQGRGREIVWICPVDELEKAIIKIKECLK